MNHAQMLPWSILGAAFLLSISCCQEYAMKDPVLANVLRTLGVGARKDQLLLHVTLRKRDPRYGTICNHCFLSFHMSFNSTKQVLQMGLKVYL